MKGRAPQGFVVCVVIALALVFQAGGFAAENAAQVAMTPPSGFQAQTVVSGLNLPTSFAFAPDGRIFIAEKSGVVRVFKNGALLPTPLIDISANVNNYWDRGLIGMALDPNFATNGYVYLLYPYEATASDDAGGKTSRLSRYTVVGDTASPSTEKVLLGTEAGSACTQFPAGSDCIPAEWYGHGVGDIHFGGDGSMFLSNGDAANWNVVNDDALRAQDLNSLAGKILRIDPATGQGLLDNPYWNGDPNAARSKVWAYGVRNAYRFSIRPNSGTPGTVYAGDVGWDTTEEVDAVPKGANLGWPCYEGTAVQPGYQPKAVCQALYAAVANDPSKWTQPIIAYDHNGVGAAVTGGAFYTGTTYPSAYQGVYFFGDYARNQLRYASVNSSNVVTSGPTDFDPAADSPVNIQVGPDGNVYALAIGLGQLIKYVYNGSAPPSGGFLSDLAWTSATNGWGPVEKDMSNGEQGTGDGRTITLSGVTYPKGLGTHAASDVRYAITGCTSFQSDIGVDDEVGANGSVVFQVYLDGTKAYDSGTMTGSTATKSINLDLTGKSELRLVVTNGGDTIDYDHADWANARITCTAGGGGGGGGKQGPAPAFGPATSLPAGTATHSVVAADVNGDGKFDLVAANALSHNVSVFKGNGDGTFQTGTSFSAGAAVKPKTAAVADLDADGKPDIVTANQDASTISVLKGTGGGAFAAPVQYPTCSHAHEAAIGDLNGDGKPDAAVACWGGTVISVLVGNGDGTFRPKVDYTAGGQPHSIVIRDFNNDGKPDLAVANFTSNNVSVLRGVGDGTFQAAVNYTVGTSPHSIRTGDLNGDGKPDLVTANAGSNTVTVLLGNGDGTFGSGQSYSTGLVPKGIAIGDVNGNGIPDVVTANTAGNGDGVTGNPGGDRVSVLLGDGTGTLGTPTEFLVGQTPYSVYLADLNGDGKLDLATAEWDSNTVTARLNTTSAGGGSSFSVASVSPASGATGVPAASNVSATFSADLDQTTVNSSTVLLQQGGTTVPGQLSYNAATRTVTLDPTSDLQAGLTYTATVVGGANGVKDTSGSTLASSKIWSFTISTGGGVGATSFLSDLTWTSATNGWGPVEKDKSNGQQAAGDGTTITLSGVTYPKGLGTHAASDVRYAITGCTSFQSDIGVDDEVGANGSVVFQVYLDGTKAYDSGTMTGSTATKSINLDLTGKSELRLVVTNGGDTIDYDHADWANARITCGGGGGNQPPVPTISSPTASTTFAVGDVITFQGSATDLEDGTLPGTSLTWQINIQHCIGASCHIHYFITQSGTGGTFTVPDHGDMYHFDITLTATDSAGTQASTTVSIQPRTVQLTLATNPTGLQVVSGGTSATAPYTATAVQGATVTIFAPSPQGSSTFSSWSDGGAQQHNVTLGTTDATYTANFTGAQPLSVTSVSPADGATGVPAASNVTATFSADVDQSTLNSSAMTLRQATATVPATLSYNASTRTVTLDPTSDLQPGLTYTATVVGAAGGVKDTAGNQMTSSKVWTFTVASGTTSYLGDTAWTSATNGWGPVERNKSNGEKAAGDGKTITLNGTTYKRGLGTNSISDIRFNLAGKCTSFKSDVGIDDEVGSKGSVIFKVYLDGTQVYSGSTMTGSSGTKSISLDVTGKNELRLYVDPSTNGTTSDHADWANARITC